MSTGKGPRGLARAASFAGGIAAFVGAVAFPPTRPFVVKHVPSPGEGPNEEARSKGYFKTYHVAVENGQMVRGMVADGRDPGYGSTAVMVSEAALCLALEGAELRTEGGILTPASAMGMRLVERLRAAGLTFEIQA